MDGLAVTTSGVAKPRGRAMAQVLHREILRVKRLVQSVQTWLVGQLRQTAHWLTKVGSSGKKGLSSDSSGLNTQNNILGNSTEEVKLY